jgi:hypothetical protein
MMYVCLYLSLILIIGPQCCICNYKGKIQATSPGFKHGRVNASSKLGSWYGTSSCHANCRATLHSRVHQLSPNWDYALSWELRFVVSSDLHKIMFASLSVECYFESFLVLFTFRTVPVFVHLSVPYKTVKCWIVLCLIWFVYVGMKTVEPFNFYLDLTVSTAMSHEDQHVSAHMRTCISAVCMCVFMTCLSVCVCLYICAVHTVCWMLIC